ncbi:MAG: hypothetical protein ACLTTJ_08220 [Blautia sp.]
MGYEVTRTMISGGKVEKEVVGFTTENQFSDHVTTVNNRVITYASDSGGQVFESFGSEDIDTSQD